MTPQEAATYLHVTLSTLENYRRRRTIPSQGKGQRAIFTKEDLDAYAARRAANIAARGRKGAKRGPKIRRYKPPRPLVEEVIAHTNHRLAPEFTAELLIKFFTARSHLLGQGSPTAPSRESAQEIHARPELQTDRASQVQGHPVRTMRA